MTIATAGSEETRRAKPAGQDSETARRVASDESPAGGRPRGTLCGAVPRDGARRSSSLATLYALF